MYNFASSLKYDFVVMIKVFFEYIHVLDTINATMRNYIDVFKQ